MSTWCAIPMAMTPLRGLRATARCGGRRDRRDRRPAGADLAAVHAGVERLRVQLAETRTCERDEVSTTSIPDPCP